MPQLRLLAALLLAFSGLGVAGAQTAGYITDQLRLEARSGPTTGHRVVRMLESGTEVTVLEKQEDYSRIRMPGGGEAWILNRYLMSEPSGRSELAAIRAELTRISEENTRLETELDQSRAYGGEADQERASLAQSNAQLEKELQEIKNIAGSALEINQLNEELQTRVVNLERELQLAQQENMAMSDSSDRDWFVTGAGVLVGGMILGLIIPNFRSRKRRGWGEL